MIHNEHVHVAFKKFQLKDIHIELKNGYTYGLIGRNGAGKSTWLKTLIGLYPPTSGQITFHGEPIQPAVLERMSIIHDRLSVNGEYKLKQLLPIMRASYPTWDDAQFYASCELYQLPLNKKLKHFSKGMQMKAQFALAFSRQADYLIMDEPTAGLDPVARRQFVDGLRNWLAKDEQRTIIFSTHLTTDLEQFADYILLMDEGELRFCLPVDEIEERFVVVRGFKEQMNEELRLQLPLLDWKGERFSTLVDRSQIPVPSHLHTEKASLEDVMYFMTEVEKR